jgi:hypothetical protein
VPSKTGDCPLCGEHRPLTKEHVYPQWMLRDWGAKPIWIGPTLGVMRDLVVPVCRTCNAWMNKRFETPTMPLLRSLVEGTERFITPKQQLRLTLWCTKTIMMFDIAADPNLATPHPGYIEFRRTGRPIPRSRLWLGRCGDVWPMEQLIDRPRNYLLPHGSFTRVIQVGPLLVFLLWVRGASYGDPPSIDHRWFRTYLRPIHPCQGRMDWPGEWVISRAMEEAFRQLYPVRGMASFHAHGVYKKPRR